MLVIGIIIHFIAAILLTAFVNWVGLISWRRIATEHWTERARLLWPVRFTAGINVFLLPVVLSQIHAFIFPESFHEWMADTIAGIFGSLFGNYPLDREIFPQLNFKSWRHQVMAWWGLRFGIWIVLVAACVMMPVNFSWKMLAVVLGYLILHFSIQGGLFLKYLKLVKFLRPAEPRLQKIVNDAVARTNVTVRATWQFGGSLPNAFAFPTTRELIFGERLLEICDDKEVAAICAHELGHLKESKLILAARLIGSLAAFPLIFIQPLTAHLGTIGFFIPYVGMFLIIQFTKRLSHQMEKHADEFAMKDQVDEGVYARALEKLYRENQSPAVNASKRHTHPHLYDRMLSAGITPDFPRPSRPKRLTLLGWVLIFAFGLFLGLAFASN